MTDNDGLPAHLAPDPGERGVATAGPQPALDRAVAAWTAFHRTASGADLSAPARSGRRTGLEVVLRLGAWPESRGLAQIVGDARAGRTGPLDQDELERRVLSVHADTGRGEALAAIEAARDELAVFAASAEWEQVALLPTRSPLGPLPVLTFLHATAYQLAVSALDLEPCGAAVQETLLTDGLLGLVDATGGLAARQGVTGSLTALTPDGAYGFGARGSDWRTATVAVGAGSGPAVEAGVRTILDVTSGRGEDVAGMWRRREIVAHDLPGLLRLAPVVEQVPGIPGGALLRTATRSLSGVAWLLGRLPFG